jgi:hypothetical protein
MFIRWQSRKRGSPAFGPSARIRGRVVRADTRKLDVHWAAILVQAVRVDGNPKQEHVAYLGGITETAIEIQPQRCYFWEGVTECLDKLSGRITPDERMRIEQSIAERVPLPTGVEFKQTAKAASALWSDPVDQQRVLETCCRAAMKRWPT